MDTSTATVMHHHMSPTMSRMPMASSGGHSMSESSASMMDMQSMAMTFFVSSNTPLYSMAWTPQTVGQYTGACVFLIVLAAVFRALLALRIHIHSILNAAQKRRNGGLEYELYETKSVPRPWRAGEAVLTASLDVVVAGVAYLLMLAVMTLNVGYFLSVLAGVFVGSMAFGHFIGNTAVH